MTMNPLRRALPAVTAALLAAACLLGAPTDAAAQSRPMMYTDRWTDADTAFLFRVLDAAASDIVDGATPSEWTNLNAALAREGLEPVAYGGIVGFLSEVRRDALLEEKRPGTIRARGNHAELPEGEIRRMLDNIAFFQRHRASITRRMVAVFLLFQDGTAPDDP